MDLEVRGAHDLERVGRQLKATGNGDLRKELLRGMREQGKPVIAAVRSSAREHLPHRGGLADLVARSKFSTRTKLSGNQVGTRIEGKSKHNIKAMDAGRLRHPVFGRGGWAAQSITPGWFTKPAEDSLPHVRTGMQRVLEDIANRIERSV